MSELRFLPEDSTPEQVLAELKRELPDRDFKAAQMLTKGWDNQVALVDGRWIFRFPKDDEFDYEPELALLERLQGLLTVPVPKVLFRGRQVRMMGYEALSGRFMEEDEARRLSHAQRQALAGDLARFLWAVNQELSPAEARAMGWSEEKLILDQSVVLAYLRREHADLYEAAAQNVEKLQTLRFQLEPRFLYNDLHIDNFLLNEDSRLSGVIDFGDCAIGDPCFEFWPIWRYDRALFEETVRAYEGMSGLKISRPICELLAWEDSLSDVGELMDKPESGGHKNALRWMRRWSLEGK